MIPNTTPAKIAEAMELFDRDLRGTIEWQEWEQKGNYKHAIEHRSQRYPVKQIISMATGVDTNSFSGGEEANSYVMGRGFSVVPLRPEEVNEETAGEVTPEESRVAILSKLEDWLQHNPRIMPEELRELRDEFVRRFPKETIKDLTLEQYALGHEKSQDSFCYWLEFKTNKLGGIRGGNVTKHGVWWSKEANGWQWNRMYSSAEDALTRIKGGLTALVEAVERGDFNELDEIGSERLGQSRHGLRCKPLYLYYPDEFLPISQSAHLAHFLTSFGAQPQGEVLSRNHQLLQLLRSIPEFEGFDTQQLSRFLYGCLSPWEGVSSGKWRWWIEKTIVSRRPDRESGEYALGRALWSPQRDKRGADIYRFMRDIKPGDIILHLTDNIGFTGISRAAAAVEEFDCVPNTEGNILRVI